MQKSYPTNSHLHDGIKAALDVIIVCRYMLHGNYLVELGGVARQGQDVFIAKRRHAGYVCTAVIRKKSKPKHQKSKSRWADGQIYEICVVVWIFIVNLQGLASSSSVILMKGRTGFSTKEPKPIRNLLVSLAISLVKLEPKSLIISRSLFMDADRSIR